MKTIRKISVLIALALLFVANCYAQDSNPALDVIMNRTSIRKFTGEPVSKENLETILKAGMAAPTAMNVQPWRFVVVTDKDKIAKVFGAGPRSGMFTQAGAVIVVCGQTTVKRRPFGQPDGPETEMPNMFWYEDCSAAAQNILLAAKALGLGAVWTAGYPAEERVKPIAEALGIPSGVVPLCIIPIGVPAENPNPKDKWKPENVHWEQW
ncbi:MAG: nitroreductase family protein [Bacteroidales bacterium]|nr:nitroreductase family protein [Bacteroidales bacterium]